MATQICQLVAKPVCKFAQWVDFGNPVSQTYGIYVCAKLVQNGTRTTRWQTGQQRLATMPANHALRNKPKAHHTARTQTGLAGNACRLVHFALA